MMRSKPEKRFGEVELGIEDMTNPTSTTTDLDFNVEAKSPRRS